MSSLIRSSQPRAANWSNEVVSQQVVQCLESERWEIPQKQRRGSSFTVGRRPVRLVYTEELESRDKALVREQQLKRWTRAKKEALIAGDLLALKRA